MAILFVVAFTAFIVYVVTGMQGFFETGSQGQAGPDL